MIPSVKPLRKAAFLTGVFFISLAVLMFQIVQTRILSVISWYYLAFFGISMAMLGMTVGAVYVYLRREHFNSDNLATSLTNYSLACAVSIPVSLMLQFSLITSLTFSFTTVVAWILLTIAMAVPYIFAGVVVSLALTRSPFPVSQVYGVDLLGAAIGCVSVVLLLNILDAPSAIIFSGCAAAISSWRFSICAHSGALPSASAWRNPKVWALGLLVMTILNAATPLGLRPILVKDALEKSSLSTYEKWNSYSRIIARQPETGSPPMWGAAPTMPKTYQVPQVYLNIDGLAGTTMFSFDGTLKSIEFLQYDLVNLAYHLPNLSKAAIIGVGGGRDVMSAHLFGVKDITGIELNPIFIDLHTKNAFYKPFSNLTKLPNLQLHVADARSWFASTREKFDLIQMSMIDTWAATGAGAFSLSENGLYTLEGWRAFFKALNNNGIFTVSRWYSPSNINETGRMISLAAATVLDSGVTEARSHIFVAHADKIATLVLSKQPFTAEQLHILYREMEKLGFEVLIAPDHPSTSPLLNAIVSSSSTAEINRAVADAYLDLSVPTDNRPFFFNQLKLTRIADVVKGINTRYESGVAFGNLIATLALVLILTISIVAVFITIVFPLRSAAQDSEKSLITIGTSYFFLIGLGFMLAEISMLQFFSVYLGHPIYSLGVCLFSLILATGVGSLASGRINIGKPISMLVWGILSGGYLLLLQGNVAEIFQATTDQTLWVRIAISVALLCPLGFLLGFAFPTGMRLVNAVDSTPAPWFWGINGATGVLASVLAVMISMNFGINVTAAAAGVCYWALIPIGITLIKLAEQKGGLR
jgi:spermidine synthase